MYTVYIYHNKVLVETKLGLETIGDAILWGDAQANRLCTAAGDSIFNWSHTGYLT